MILASLFRGIQDSESIATNKYIFDVTTYICPHLRQKQKTSVADPDPNPAPDPPDPHVFGPTGYGSGSISQRYGSGFFYHHAKIVRKTLIPTIL
jgi:hypothetical protein